MDQDSQPRKAASSDRGRQHRRNTSSASHNSRPSAGERPQSYLDQQNAQPEASPYALDHDQAQDRSRGPSEQPQAPNRRLSQQPSSPRSQSRHHSRASSSAAQVPQLRNKGSTDSDDWNLLQRDDDTPSGPSSYDFPGTWPTALHDTSAALTQVSSATASYASALTHSGIGKAGWSVGTAAFSSANKGALSLVSWAADHTGTGVDQLPRPVGKWLKGGRRKIEEQRRAEQKIVERRRRRESGRQDLQPFGDERGPFVLETAEMSSTGEIVGPLTPLQRDGFTEAMTRGGSGVAGQVTEQREHDSEDATEEEEDDGMTRLFEFDD